MKLKTLKVKFQTIDSFFHEVNSALKGHGYANDLKNEVVFDSPKSFRRFFNQNKVQLLTLISRMNPKSVYQLEKMTGRKYPAVLKDCRQLESLGFIHLKESVGIKKVLYPTLTFDYDFIRVGFEFEEIIPISEKSIRAINQLATS